MNAEIFKVGKEVKVGEQNWVISRSIGIKLVSPSIEV